MLNTERQSIRSPTTSQVDSYGNGSIARTNGRPYQLRSSTIDEHEREDNEYDPTLDDIDEQERTYRPPPRNEDPYISALKFRFPHRAKSDYVYSRPAGPSNSSVPPPAPPAPPLPSTTQPTVTTTTTPRTGPYQSTLRPTHGSTNVSDGSDDKTFSRPNLRRVNPDQQNTYARRIGSEMTSQPSSSKPISSNGTNVRITEPTIDINQPTISTYTHPSGIPRTQESIFETVHSHDGPISYLGTNTFSQFEQCLRECLERERRRTGIASHITRHEIPPSAPPPAPSFAPPPAPSFAPPPVSQPNTSVHDYGYDPVVTSSSSSLPRQEFYPRSSSPYLSDYTSKSVPTFLLDDIRHINVALSRSGISLFPYERCCFESHRYPTSVSLPSTTIQSSYPTERRIIGEVVSACRLVEEDTPLLYNGHRNQAVQNVWNALQRHQPFSHINSSRSNVYPKGPYDI
ncbi:unnamed protein product [Rotaria sordida]|uniref:Uncharacterized protein n=1 Tax=Rotaria sordida TaxID=392033 RepID=A0A814Y1D6_9BILA|nr:unnamed protein product [Rotaria sordida]